MSVFLFISSRILLTPTLQYKRKYKKNREDQKGNWRMKSKRCVKYQRRKFEYFLSNCQRWITWYNVEKKLYGATLRRIASFESNHLVYPMYKYVLSLHPPTDVSSVSINRKAGPLIYNCIWYEFVKYCKYLSCKCNKIYKSCLLKIECAN